MRGGVIGGGRIRGVGARRVPPPQDREHLVPVPADELAPVVVDHAARSAEPDPPVLRPEPDAAGVEVVDELFSVHRSPLSKRSAPVVAGGRAGASAVGADAGVVVAAVVVAFVATSRSMQAAYARTVGSSR